MNRYQKILEIKYIDYERKFNNHKQLFNSDKIKIKNKINKTENLIRIKYLIKYNLFIDVENNIPIKVNKYMKYIDKIHKLRKKDINFNYRGKDRIYLFLLDIAKTL